MNHLLRLLAAFALAAAAASAGAQGTRIKDLGRIDGVRDNDLVGYGLVTGLAGTGDSLRSKMTRQSLSNMLYQFDLNVPADQVQSRNVAAVIVTSRLPAFAKPGDKVDVTVTSIGDARSLLGGTLMMVGLKGADNRVHALAQGALSVGGYKYDLNGNLVQKNHPTVGTIPAGGSVEVGTHPQLLKPGGVLTLVMSESDYTTASRVAAAINTSLGADASARAVDPVTVEVAVDPRWQRDLVGFVTRIESLTVEPDHRARVVVNERTGTVVAGGDARISKVTVSHGDLKVSVVTDYAVSQPAFVRQTAPDVRTEVVPRTRINVSEDEGESVSLAANTTVTDLVRALTKVRTSPRDMISILQGIKAAGALHAELVIQ